DSLDVRRVLFGLLLPALLVSDRGLVLADISGGREPGLALFGGRVPIHVLGLCQFAQCPAGRVLTLHAILDFERLLVLGLGPSDVGQCRNRGGDDRQLPTDPHHPAPCEEVRTDFKRREPLPADSTQARQYCPPINHDRWSRQGVAKKTAHATRAGGEVDSSEGCYLPANRKSTTREHFRRPVRLDRRDPNWHVAASPRREGAG